MNDESEMNDNAKDSPQRARQRRWLVIAEYISLASSIAGTAAAIATQQIGFAAIPLTITLGLNLDNRSSLRQLNQQQKNNALQQFPKFLEPLEVQLARVEEFASALDRRTQQQHQEWRDSVAQIQQIVNPLKLQLAQLKNQWQDLDRLTQKQIRELKESRSEQDEAIAAQFEHLFDRLENHLGQVETVSQQIPPPVARELNGFKEQLAQFQNAFRVEIDDAIAALESQLPALEHKITDLEAERETLPTAAQINQIEQHLERLQEQYNLAQNRFLKTEKLPETIQVEFSSMVSRRGAPVPTDAVSWQCLQILRGHRGSVNAIAIARDPKTIVSGSEDNTIKLWHFDSGEEERSLKASEADWSGAVKTVALSPDQKIIASGSDDNTIQLWQLANGKPLNRLQGHDRTVRAIAFSPTHPLLVSGSDDKTIKLWHLETGTIAQTLDGQSDWFTGITAIAISPNGQLIASGSDDKTIKLWHLETGAAIGTLNGHLGTVNALVFSPDSQTLISGSSDKTIKLWHLDRQREIRTLMGHSDSVDAIAIDPAGQLLATGSWDSRIKLWNFSTGQEICTLKGHASAVMALAFADATTLISSSSDTTIKIWQQCPNEPRSPQSTTPSPISTDQTAKY
jgi:WD40 repeat protein